MAVEIEAMVTEFLAKQAEADMVGCAWPPVLPEDPRWQAMPYLLQATAKEEGLNE